MKITLNDSIPPTSRLEVERAVKKHAGDCSIVWMPSRFPRFVMLVDPETTYDPCSEGGSMFETPHAEDASFAVMTKTLEEKIKSCLAAGS